MSSAAFPSDYITSQGAGVHLPSSRAQQPLSSQGGGGASLWNVLLHNTITNTLTDVRTVKTVKLYLNCTSWKGQKFHSASIWTSPFPLLIIRLSSWEMAHLAGIDKGPVLDWTDNGLMGCFRKWKKKVEILFKGPLNNTNYPVKCNYTIY